jgi:hypothetical protein
MIPGIAIDVYRGKRTFLELLGANWFRLLSLRVASEDSITLTKRANASPKGDRFVLQKMQDLRMSKPDQVCQKIYPVPV